MIQNDKELAVTQDRIAYFLRLLAQLRVSSRPEEFPLVASGYRAEVELMQQDVLDYLTRHAQARRARSEQSPSLSTFRSSGSAKVHGFFAGPHPQCAFPDVNIAA